MNIKDYFNNTKNEKNQKILRFLISSSLIIIICFIIFNAFSFLVYPPKDKYDKYDSVSGKNINTYKGAVTPNFVNIHFLEEVQKAGMQIDSFAKMQHILEYFFTYSYPDIKNLSYKKASLKNLEDTFTFTLVANTEQIFDLVINTPAVNKLNLSIKSHGNTIYIYKDDFYEKVYDSKFLINKLLPKKFTLQDQNKTQFILDKNILTNEYEIYINSCGNEEQNQEARKTINEWLETINLNKKDFTFIIPKRCDGENRHHHENLHHND